MSIYDSLVVAIDGPAASGKGTVARRLAQHLGLAYLDTGKLYRAVGAKLLATQDVLLPPEQPLAEAIVIAKSITMDDLNNPELGTEEVGRAASIISAIPEVRDALLDFQRRVAESPQGAVLDGRDIGTVVWPQAQVKFYITAEAPIRAERRFKQLQADGKPVIYGDILRDIEARDARDSSRIVAPLKPAEDAVLVDTSAMDMEAVFQHVLAMTVAAAKV